MLALVGVLVLDCRVLVLVGLVRVAYGSCALMSRSEVEWVGDWFGSEWVGGWYGSGRKEEKAGWLWAWVGVGQRGLL